jgi:predicted GNAT superfamily acetyltransferase
VKPHCVQPEHHEPIATMTRSSTRSSPVLQPSTAITLRALKTHADLAACVQLQRDTWGEQYDDCVPASILKVSQMVGGVCGGAFTPEGGLVGFVYGLTGVRDGQLMHWSHMLAVTPEYRNHGVGRRLKEYQRDVLRELGVEVIYWTFDPLVARNAHLNLNRLGATVEEYVADMYGDTGSALHAFGTDRFVVSWPVARQAGRAGEPPAVWRAAPLATANGPGAGGGSADLLRIEIPGDVEEMAVADAREWRQATRPAFERLLGDGYRVAGFYTDSGARCYYVLSRRSES